MGRDQSKEDSEAQLTIASEILSGCVEAISTIYLSLENSSKILAKNIAENTVDIVHHKYGMDAANVTEDTLNSMGNVYLTVKNAGSLAPKKIIKKVAKDA